MAFSSKSSSIKRVFETRVLYTTRVSKTQDASLLTPFKHVLTYYFVLPYYASLHIPSIFLYFMRGIFFLYRNYEWTFKDDDHF